jgi:hypothetical protein
MLMLPGPDQQDREALNSLELQPRQLGVKPFGDDEFEVEPGAVVGVRESGVVGYLE